MKTVIILEQEDFNTIKTLLHDAIIDINECGEYTYRLGKGQEKLNQIYEMLKEK